MENTKLEINSNVIIKNRECHKGITLVAFIITIIVMLVLARIGIAITNGIIEKAQYSAFVSEMSNLEETVNMYILEKNIETANSGEEQENAFQTQLTTEDLNELPIELKQEILYVRDKINNSPEIKASASEYLVDNFSEDDLFFVDGSVAEGQEKAYIYDEQSKSVYKAKPTIISGKAMFGYDYGKIIGVQGLLAKEEEQKEEQKEEEEIPVQDKYFSITFNSNGGTGTMNTQIVKEGDFIIPKNQFEKSNYKFYGWKIGNQIFNEGDIIAVNENKELIVQWGTNYIGRFLGNNISLFEYNTSDIYSGSYLNKKYDGSIDELFDGTSKMVLFNKHSVSFKLNFKSKLNINYLNFITHSNPGGVKYSVKVYNGQTNALIGSTDGTGVTNEFVIRVPINQNEYSKLKVDISTRCILGCITRNNYK